MDPEKIELFKSSNETPIMDTEKDKQEILKDLELQLANKQQELAVLDSRTGYMQTEELAAKKSQLNDEIIGIESRKSTLGQEVVPPQVEIKTAPEQSIRPEVPADDFKTTIETDPDFLKKKFAEQKIDLGSTGAEQTKTVKEQFNKLREKTSDDLGVIGKEYNTKIADAKAQSQIEQLIEQPPAGQFETPEQLKEEMERNAEQVTKMTVEAAPNKQEAEQIKKVAIETAPDKPESIKEIKTEKKSALSEIFSNPEAENRIKEIQTELGQTKEEIQALKEGIAVREQKVKTLEKEMDKLEQDNLVAFFRNTPRLERANERGAAAVTRGMAISELHTALEKYDKIQDRGFMEKIMKKLSAKMKKLFKQAYPDLFLKEAKPEKVEKTAKAKKAKSAIRGKGLIGNEGVSIA